MFQPSLGRQGATGLRDVAVAQGIQQVAGEDEPLATPARQAFLDQERPAFIERGPCFGAEPGRGRG